MHYRSTYEKNNHLLRQALLEKQALIAVHRGARGGNIIENTISAYEIAISMGADLLECDLSMSTDGTLYLFHDGEEQRLLGEKSNITTMHSAQIDALEYKNSIDLPSGVHVQRLKELLERFSGTKQLFNMDRCWSYMPQVMQALRQYPKTVGQAILKTPVKPEYLQFFIHAPEPFMYMPIVKTAGEITMVLAHPEINTVGIEIIAEHQDDELLSQSFIHSLRELGLFVWVNTLVLSSLPNHRLSGGFNDDRAVLGNPDDTWGALFARGVNVLQTDWPAQLKQYRDAYFAK